MKRTMVDKGADKAVLLINPPWVRARGSLWSKLGSCMPPLGLAYLAAYLEKKGHGVRILDMEAEGMAVSLLEQWLSAIEEPAYVGVTATTNLIDNALKIAAVCRGKFPGAKVVLGGVHAAVMTDEVLADENVDYVVRGEGELTFCELVSGEKAEKILGLSFARDGKHVHNPDRPFLADLDELPFPAYHLLPMTRYRASIGAYKRSPVVSVVSSRGCPGRCTYCYGFYLGRRMRAHSPRYLVEMIKWLKKDFGVREITFYDDTFTVFKDKVREFCHLLLEQGVDITWSCFARTDFVDEETLRAMKGSGCHQVCYGVESGSDEILRGVKKPMKLAGVKEVITMTKRLGVETRAAFMLGNPGETKETIEKTIGFAIEIDPDIAVFNITTPYPGTEMYGWAKEKGYIKDAGGWSDYDWARPVMELPTISRKEIEHYYKVVHRRFFGRPGYMLKRLLRIRCWHDLKMSFQAVIAVFFR